MLKGYLEAFDEIERELEEFDGRVMKGPSDGTGSELGYLVELRVRVASLRRALASHRELFLALTKPELGAIASSESAERFRFISARLEHALDAARDSRDSVVGSFNVLIARTEQRTNEIVKVLTLASILLLPGALIAGVVGMELQGRALQPRLVLLGGPRLRTDRRDRSRDPDCRAGPQMDLTKRPGRRPDPGLPQAARGGAVASTRARPWIA